MLPHPFVLPSELGPPHSEYSRFSAGRSSVLPFLPWVGAVVGRRRRTSAPAERVKAVVIRTACAHDVRTRARIGAPCGVTARRWCADSQPAQPTEARGSCEFAEPGARRGCAPRAGLTPPQGARSMLAS